MNPVCAWCSAPRIAGSICVKCGADYEKAAQIKAGKKATAPPRKSKKAEREEQRRQRFVDAWTPVQDPEMEYKLCLWVIPGMLGLAFLMEIVGVGDGLLRIVFGMPVHEFGHAVAGWFTGFSSVPTLWKTILPGERGFMAPVLVLAGIAYGINYARLNGKAGLLLAGVFLLLLQFIGTWVLEKETAEAFITWAGDGVGFMLATALMAGFFFDKHTNWYKGYLRWGFAFIGAAAFADLVAPWWVSLNDISAVPYGVSGGTYTDTYKMIHFYGWEMDEVIHRYVYLSVACFGVLVAFCISGVREAARAVEVRQSSDAESRETDESSV